MTVTAAFLKGVHPYAFRSGESGIITGVKVASPKGKREYSPRACYEVTYKDGFIDLVPLSDVKDKHYVIEIKED